MDVVGVDALLHALRPPVGARDHLIRFVIGIGGDGDVLRPLGGGGADLLLLDQVPAPIVGVAIVVDAGDRLDVAALFPGHHLVQAVVLVGGLIPAVRAVLLDQVAQAVVSVGLA